MLVNYLFNKLCPFLFYVDYANIYFFFNIRQINNFDIIIDFAEL